MNSISVGVFVFTDQLSNSDEGLGEGNCILSSALPCDELAIDTLEVDVRSNCLYRVPYETESQGKYLTVDGKLYLCRFGAQDITTTPYGTPVYFMHNSELIGKFYSVNIRRKTKTVFTIKAVSAVGLLDKLPHNGDLYQGATIPDVLADIIGSTFTYSIAPELQNVPVYGLIRPGSRRDSLRQLVFAEGIRIAKDTNGDPYYTFLTAAQSTNIPNDRLFLEGDVNFETPATGVDVPEYAYLQTANDPENTLFDNTDASGAADHQRVEFKGPHYDLTVTGTLTKNEEGVNYAIVTGTGALTGKAYTEQQKTVSLRLTTTAKENIVTVKGYTLVSIANSENVAARVLAYYSSASTVRGDMAVGEEKPGDQVTFEDPFDDPAQAFLESLDISISHELRARATFIEDFVPAGYGNYYQNSVLLTEDGNWTPPAGVTKVRAVLIGGAQGGYSGFYGNVGATGGGEGGLGGRGGFGGKILNQQLAVTPGVPIAAHMGTPGDGATANASGSVAGDLGLATTFGSLTSANGVVAPNGFYDIFTGARHGVSGGAGLPGGKGMPNGLPVVHNGVTYYPGDRGWQLSYYGYQVSQTGGYGGGAATAGNGGDGYDAQPEVYGGGGFVNTGGSGGGGGPGAAGSDATGVGNGGDGGDGGGGGGQWTGALFGAQGAGGFGGKGAKGAKGGVLIYY